MTSHDFAIPAPEKSHARPPARGAHALLTAIGLGRHIERLGTRDGTLPGLLAVTAFTVSTAALLVTLAGVHAFSSRAAGTDAASYENLYLSLAFAAAGMLVAPILTLGAVAARLTLGRRDRRLAVLRLVGATRGQVGAITLFETARLALTGAICGTILYAVLVPALTSLRFGGHPFGHLELVLPWWWVILTIAVVVLLAVGSGLISLRRVAISPLGVSARTTPRPMRLARVAIFAAIAVAWLAIAQGVERLGTALMMVILAGLVAALNVVGPFVMMLLGRAAAHVTGSPRTLLAARRLVDDPRAAWRAVGSLGLGITVAGLAGTAAAMSQGQNARDNQVLLDLRTGALVTLAIIAVIAATSTGVVQAARLVDRRQELRMLALAGARRRDLVVATRREVTVPLAVTVLMAGGFCGLIVAPTSSAAGATTYLWLAGAIGGSILLMLLAVQLTTPLLRDAMREPAGGD